jgi:hypothetical protein
MAKKKRNLPEGEVVFEAQARALGAPAIANQTFQFDDLVAAFFTGFEDEGLRLDPPVTVKENRDIVEPYLRQTYTERFDRRKGSLPSNTLKCAEVLGRITFAMVRSESIVGDGSPLFQGDDPIEGPKQPPGLMIRHVVLARDMYGHYTNTNQLPPPRNRLLGPIRLPGERGLKRETDEPCPLCP